MRARTAPLALVGLAAATALALAPSAAFAAESPTPTPTPAPTTTMAPPATTAPPSIAQVCAATGQPAIDALLKGVATSDLVGLLKPLATVVVPTTTVPSVVGAVQLDDARKALKCDALSTTTPPVPTATDGPTPTVTAAPTTTTRTSAPAPVILVPRGAPETGSW